MLSLRADGYDAATRLDFDYAVMAWWDRFQAIRHEPGQVPNMPTPRKNHHWGYKHDSDAEVLKILLGTSDIALDPVLEGVTADDLFDIIGDWDAYDA